VVFPPGYEPSKITYYRSEYKPIRNDLLPVFPGDWVAIVQSGHFASPTYRCEFRRTEQPKTEDPALARLELDPNEAPDPSHVKVSAGEDAPPMASGFYLEVPAAGAIKPGEVLEVVCHFTVADDGNDRFQHVPVYVLISGRQFENLVVEPVLVPKDATTASNGLRRGRFTIDLARHFYHPDRGGRTLEDDFYVTAVSRELFSAPVRVQVEQGD